MLDAMLDGVVLLNAKGEVESLNSEACRILETSTEAAVGRPIEDLLGDRLRSCLGLCSRTAVQ
jgi:PAS domain-containing protein